MFSLRSTARFALAHRGRPPVRGPVREKPLAVPAPHHCDPHQMLVNFPLWLWLTFRAWSASGSSWSSASSTVQRLRHQLAPARCFNVVPISTSTATETCRTTGSGPKPHVSKSPAPITSADSRVPFPFAVPAQQREIALSRSQDQILAASGSRRMDQVNPKGARMKGARNGLFFDM